MAGIAVACYRPKPGRDVDLLDTVRQHDPTLRAHGFVTDRPRVVMRSRDGTIVEVIEWASPEAKTKAHEHEAVRELWERLIECAEFPSLSELPESAERFANFEPVDL
jgi:hypothetical protein